MNKSDLIDLIYKRLGKYKKNDVKKVVNGVFNAITYGLKNGEKIEIRGLGTFKVKKKPARIVRNPKNGNIVK
jgi:integration host factor subunit beta